MLYFLASQHLPSDCRNILNELENDVAAAAAGAADTETVGTAAAVVESVADPDFGTPHGAVAVDAAAAVPVDIDAREHHHFVDFQTRFQFFYF